MKTLNGIFTATISRGVKSNVKNARRLKRNDELKNDPDMTIEERYTNVLDRLTSHEITKKEAVKELVVLHDTLPLKPISRSLRDERKLKGLTLREVEERTGISNAYLSQLENNKIKSPSYKVVMTLCHLYRGRL